VGEVTLPPPLYDVAVVGGGLVGAAAALGVAARGRSVLLVELAEPAVQRASLGMDLRTLAVSPASQALLENLGVWNALAAAPYRRMEVWEERGTRAMVFDAAEVSRAELGWIVESSPMVVALWEALRRSDNVVIRPGRVLGLAAGTDVMNLDLEDGTVAARLVLAADGAASALRTRLGVAIESRDMEQVALATVIRTARPHEGVAYQRFLLDGPVALLPGVDPRLCSVVWSQSPERAQHRQALGDREFATELERAMQARLGAVEAVDRRMTFPLKQQLAATFNPLPRVLLVGDAARVVHPLAGLGANLGLEDVREVLAVLAGIGSAGDPGAAGLWRAFDRQRRIRARLMLGVMSALRRVYARGDPLSQWARNAGVGWLDRAAPVKRQIMMEAMGLGPVSRASAGFTSPPAPR
jgi:2-octaprenyl-3-methyl-6-methoxy-1,4-benzoquinol hydroxylase/2-octaprenylphenol hydroxylase